METPPENKEKSFWNRFLNKTKDAGIPTVKQHEIPKQITDLSQIPEENKPLNLEPLQSETPTRKIIPKSESAVEEKKFIVSKALLDYVDELMKQDSARPLRWFRTVSLVEAKSKQEILTLIDLKFTKGVISREENDKMVRLLTSPATKEEPKPEPEPELVADVEKPVAEPEPETKLEPEVNLGQVDYAFETDGIKYKYGDTIKIVRSNGDVEGDWKFMGFYDGRVLVTKNSADGQEISKRILPAEFAEWQKVSEKKEIEAESSTQQEQEPIKPVEQEVKPETEKPELPETPEIQPNTPLPETEEENLKQEETKLSVEQPISEVQKPELPQEQEQEQELAPVSSAISPEDLAQRQKEEMEAIDLELDIARSWYAEELTAWKSKNRERKRWWQKIQADLGFTEHEKKMPEIDKKDLLEAETGYIEAKKKKAKSLDLFSKFVEKTKGSNEKDSTGQSLEGQKYKFNEELLKQAEKERADLLKIIEESTPLREKGIIGKSFKKWANWPPQYRIPASIALMTGVAFGAGFVALPGIASYAGLRFGRAVAGSVTSQFVGGKIGSLQEKRNTEEKARVFEGVGRDINEENFASKEKEMMEFFEKQENVEQRQRFKKAMAMVATGAGTSIVSGLALSGYDHFSGGGKGGSVENATTKPQTKGFWSGLFEKKPEKITTEPISDIKEHPTIPPVKSVIENIAKPPIPETPVPETTAPTEIPTVKPASVELSSRGFIKTIDDLKGKIVEQYKGVENVPPQIKANILDQDSIKLAQKLGFYKPGTEMESGMGLKGESLGIDEKGDVFYGNIDGTKVEMLDTSTGEVTDKFENIGGKMFKVGGTNDVSDFPKINVEPNLKEGLSETFQTKMPEPPADLANQTINHGWEVPEHSDQTVAEVPSETFSTPAQSVPEAPTSPVMHEPLTAHSVAELDGKNVYLESGNASRTLTLDGVGPIAHETDFGPGAKILTLNDKFQDGDQYAQIRSAFSTATEKIQTGGQTYMKNVFPIPFEGGKINVVQGLGDDPNAVRVLLNGKEIALGRVDSSGADLVFEKSLKSSWWLSDNAYERAFKKITPIIKSLYYQASNK